MLKKLLFIFCLLIPTSFTYREVNAADKDIVCNDTGCTGFSASLFSETNILPGQVFSKTLSVKNEKDEILGINLSTQKRQPTDEDFTKIMNIVIYSDGSLIKFSNTFDTFLNSANIDLGNIDKNSVKTFEIQVAFPKDAGNKYQNKVINFDLILTIKGQESGNTSVLSTSSDSSTPTDNIIGSVLGLSDTGGQKFVVFLGELGIFFIVLGLILTFTQNPASFKKRGYQE